MQMPEPALYRQAEEEEELLQTQPLGVQVSPFAQRQTEEEEEELLTTPVQRQVEEEEEEEEELLQPKGNAGDMQTLESGVESEVKALKGKGRPLPEETRTYFEPRFGVDFRGVSIHTDTRAGRIAGMLNARAFTVGRDVVFGAGQFHPETGGGRKLLAHELTHVIQQKKMIAAKGRTDGFIQRKIPSVQEADKVRKRVMPSPPVPQVMPSWYLFIFSTFLGPFHHMLGWGCRIFDYRTGSLISKIPQHFNELARRDDPEHRKVIVAIDKFLKFTLRKHPGYTIQQFMRLIFGPPSKQQKYTAGETKVALFQGESLYKSWATLGNLVRKPNTPNPFYNWAATLHEHHHGRTVVKRFKGPLTKKILETKRNLLSGTSFPGASRSRIAAFKKALRSLVDPRAIFSFILSSNLAATEARLLRSEAQTLYQDWLLWMNKTKNYAQDDLEAYCVSWTAIRRLLTFIKSTCSQRALKSRRPAKRGRRP